MAKHTPGPWTRKFGQDVYQGSGPFDALRLIATGTPTNGSPDELAEAFANARLIAAAPELLEALDELLAAAENFERPSDKAIASARAAIAKAEGVQ